MVGSKRGSPKVYRFYLENTPEKERYRKRIATLPHDIIGEMQEQHDKSSDKGTAKG